MSFECERTYALTPWLRHVGNCGAIDSTDPADTRCICGLRQMWLRHALSAPPCKQCDLSMARHDCAFCSGAGGWWKCINTECPS